MPDCWPVAERQILEAFSRKKRKCAERTTSCGRGFASQEQGASGGALDGDEDGASHSRLNLRGI
ncbi:unnamed protein product, partial [Ascophyllum nodosum]